MNSVSARALAAVLLVGSAANAPAAGDEPPHGAIGREAPPRAIAWGDLPDAAAADFEDPVAALSTGQLVALRRIARLDARLSQDGVHPAARERLEGHRAVLAADLAADGVDADALLGALWTVAEKRRAAGAAVDPALVGERVRLAGYAFPGPPLEDGRASAYLVEQVGQCSHIPPPPPNRLVRLALPQGEAVRGTYVPLVVTGRLAATSTVATAFIVDGVRTLESAVLVEADGIERQGSDRGVEVGHTSPATAAR